MRFYILFAFLLAFVCANVVKKVVEQAEDAIERSQAGEGKIRECTCDEEHDCVAELEAQGKECTETCWGNFNKITTDPEELRQCFRDAEITIGSMITCLEDEATECTKEKTNKQVDKVDMKKLIDLGTQKLLKVEQNLTSMFTGELKQVLDTLTGFGVCVKDCVFQKNSGGFCFDKKQCQPKIDQEPQAEKAVKKCSRQVDFRKHTGEICDCAKKAGVK